MQHNHCCSLSALTVRRVAYYQTLCFRSCLNLLARQSVIIIRASPSWRWWDIVPWPPEWFAERLLAADRRGTPHTWMRARACVSCRCIYGPFLVWWCVTSVTAARQLCWGENEARKYFPVTLINLQMKHEATAVTGGTLLSAEPVMNVIKQFIWLRQTLASLASTGVVHCPMDGWVYPVSVWGGSRAHLHSI